jgi:hypothetical protein
MTVSSDVNKITYAGNGSTQVFSVNYYFLADSHLQVVLITTAGVETVQTLTTNYTVTGAGNEAGGSITMLVAPPTGVSVVIQRVVPATQETDYLANDPFPAESHERALDKLTMLVQQNERENDRSLKIPLSAVPTTSTELPAPVGNKLLAWNSNASAVINFDPADIITIVGQQTSYGDVFTGNGITTAFTLTRSPGSVFGIDVSINGVTQVPNVDYTLGGTTLTFTSAPPAAASQILARYAEVYTSYDADAQDVRYLPAGTGAVTTNVQAKLRETVSVKDFGAVGDGVTDDSAAFQAAVATLTSAGGKMIFVPKGVYVTSFELGYGQQIVGESARGSTLLKPPAGASYVITIKATVSPRQHCQIRNMTIHNPNGVTNCDGIYFNSANVANINDNHTVENVYINGFRYGVYVTGRQILTSYLNVEIDQCVKGMNVVSDPSNYAYNLNYFQMCRFVDCEEEGVRITGYNIANKFTNCNIEGNNTNKIGGIAGMYVENAEGLFLDNPYFEANGNGTAVDAINPLSNSIGLYLSGERCFNLRVTNGWMVQSGTLIAVNVSSGIIGGEISGIRFAPNATGFDIYVGDKLNGINGQPIIIDSNNFFSGKMSIKTDGAGLTSAAVRQTSACQFFTAPVTVDLRICNKFAVFSATGFNLTDITNRVPGMTLMVVNIGVGTVTIDASLMSFGVASSIAANTSKQYLVLGFGSIGKFVEI